MSGMFLDPQRPLTTCTAQSCVGCPVRNEVHCHFHGGDLVAFMAAFIPGLIVAGVGIARVSPWALIPFVLLFPAYFGLVEIRVMCSHCPHYAEPGKGLQCWANYGSPRLWKYRPGPMSTAEKVVFEGGLVIVMGYPLIFLVAGLQWLLLVLYLLSMTSFFVTLRHSYCSQCMNFACPLNTVGEQVRLEFFKRNPIIARAWQAQSVE